MKKKRNHILLTISSVVVAVILALAAVILLYEYNSNKKVTEAYRQEYPDGVRTLVIAHIGNPIFPYGEDRMRITVLEGRKTVYDTLVHVLNDGARGRFGVEWEEGHPTVTLSGDEMEDVIVRVPNF